MNTHADKTPDKKNEAASPKSKSKPVSLFTDKQPNSIAQNKIQEIADNSPQAAQFKSVQEMADNNTHTKPVQKKENNTGLPDNLKGGIENLSGISLNDVKVHYNSDKPAQLQAHAYAQGTDIHIGPGQEKHLPHEAWHVVQQKQGRVETTRQLKDKVNLNDEVGLEKEADIMGAKASRLFPEQAETEERISAHTEAPIQAVMTVEAFKQLTTLGENRKTIAAIDNALQVYHDFSLQPVDLEDQDTNTQERLRLINLVLQQTNTYILNKEQENPQHKRLAPVRSFREDVILEIQQLNGTIVRDSLIQQKIVDDPNSNTTRDLLIAVSQAPRAKTWIQDYLGVTSNPQKIAMMERLYTGGELPGILDQGFINGDGTDVLLAFPKGSALNATQKAIISLFVDRVTDLGALKKLVSQRFDIDVANIKGLEVGKPTNGGDGETVQAENDWDLEGLKRAFNIMKVLPEGHASSNASFEKLKRFSGTGGWYGDTNTVAMAYDDIKYKKTDRRTLSDKWNDRGQDVFAGKNYFDASVRHEVGHAVDHEHDFSGNYCNTANGGGWTTFDDTMALVTDYLAKNTSLFSNHQACNGGVKFEIAKLITAEESANTIKTRVIQEMVRLTNLINQSNNNNALQFDANAARTDAIFEDLQKVNLQKPWKSSGGKDVGGKTFVYSNDTKLFSYDTAARARQVSNYQFRAPAEWFAEAYAAYYQPDGTPQGYGSALQGRDATTYGYIQANVDQAL